MHLRRLPLYYLLGGQRQAQQGAFLSGAADGLHAEG